MSNTAEVAENPRRAARASFVHEALRAERWSVRQAALAIGLSHSALSSRMNGSTAFLADEIESIALLLKREPAEFYADYLAQRDDAPRPGGGAGRRSIYLIEAEPMALGLESRASAAIADLDHYRAARDRRAS
jgi:transcriptional regulator with XRE-family HTH domain